MGEFRPRVSKWRAHQRHRRKAQARARKARARKAPARKKTKSTPATWSSITNQNTKKKPRKGTKKKPRKDETWQERVKRIQRENSAPKKGGKYTPWQGKSAPKRKYHRNSLGAALRRNRKKIRREEEEMIQDETEDERRKRKRKARARKGKRKARRGKNSKKKTKKKTKKKNYLKHFLTSSLKKHHYEDEELYQSNNEETEYDDNAMADEADDDEARKDAEETINFLQRKDTQCRKLADESKKEVTSVVKTQQKMLDGLDNGRNCHKEGLSALNAAKARKNRADDNLRRQTRELKAAASAQVDMPKFVFNSLRENQCGQFFRSIAYVSAKARFDRETREKRTAEGELKQAKNNGADSKAWKKAHHMLCVLNDVSH